MTTNSILRNATEEELGRAVEENVFAMFIDMTRVLNGEREETARLSRYHASPPSPIFKGAYRARLTAEDADEAILDTISWFKGRAAPFFFW